MTTTEAQEEDLLGLVATPSQTAGPYLSIGTQWNANGRAVPEGTPGEIRLSGSVTDGAGVAVTAALLEFWQAGPDVRFGAGSGPPGRGVQAARWTGWTAWTGFTRALTNADGRYSMWTVKPGATALGDAAVLPEMEAPHINGSIFARGLLQRLVTRIYFGDEAERNAADPVLRGVADANERARLVATWIDGGYRFDIRLQGEEETPFFVP